MENTNFSKEEMFEELRNALYQTVRCLAFISSEQIALRVFGGFDIKKHGQGEYYLYSPDSTPDDFEFDPKDWEVVQTMDRLYDYAINGVARVPVHSMGGETEYAFAAAYLHDCQRGSMVHEITNGEAGAPLKCLHVAQLAAARVALDGGERFFHFGRSTPDDALTIREIALLAAMEESSVRNAAVKGKPGALRTYQQDGNTLVSREDALEWLKGRKGFMPTSRRHELGEADLSALSFNSLLDVDEYMDARCKTLGLTAGALAKKLKVSEQKVQQFFTLHFADGSAPEDKDLRQMAGLLELPVDLFVLRVREAANRDEARRIRKALEDLRTKEAA